MHYLPTLSDAKAKAIFAACAKSPEDMNVAFAVLLARRPELAIALSMLNATADMRNRVLAESKMRAPTDSEVVRLIAFFDKLSDLIHSDLGDLLCDSWTACVDQASERACA